MNKNHSPMIPSRTLYQSRYNSARFNLLLVFIFTLVNIILAVTGTPLYFLFSATIPFVFAAEGALFSGILPEEYYIDWPAEVPFEPISYFVVMAVIAGLFLAFYLLCYFMSKKHGYGWLIASAVVFVIDTVFMLWYYGIAQDNIFDYVFHAWVIYGLISGIVNAVKLKKLPEEEEAPEDYIPEVPVVNAQGAPAPIVPEEPATPEENKPAEDNSNE